MKKDLKNLLTTLINSGRLSELFGDEFEADIYTAYIEYLEFCVNVSKMLNWKISENSWKNVLTNF